MAEHLQSDFDVLVTNISLRTHEVLSTVEIAITPPYVPLPDEYCLETIVGWQKYKSGFDPHTGCMVEVTETYGLYRDLEDSIVDRRDLLVEWDNGDSIEIGLDEGNLTAGPEKVSYQQAVRLAKRILHAVEAVAP